VQTVSVLIVGRACEPPSAQLEGQEWGTGRATRTRAALEDGTVAGRRRGAQPMLNMAVYSSVTRGVKLVALMLAGLPCATPSCSAIRTMPSI